MPNPQPLARRPWAVPMLAASVLLSTAALGQPDAGPAAARRLSAAQLLADADILQRAFLALHPGLYRYNTEEELQAHFATLRRALSADLTLGEAYLAFSQFAATLRCGHTYANFYNQRAPVVQALLQNPNRVPFHFRWLDGRMVITRNFSTDSSLVPGTEVLSINGIAVGDILARLLTIARADGSNDAKRRAYLEVQGEDRYEAFDIYLPLFFPTVGTTQTFLVRAPGESTTRSTTVPALSDAQRLAGRPEVAGKDAPAWTLSFPEPDLAVLRMPTWALYNSTWDWKGFLTRSFEALVRRKTGALVIDVRGNEGGLSVGDELLAHLIGQDLEQPSYLRLVRYQKVPSDLLPYLDTWDASFKDWGNQAIPSGDGFFRLTRFDDAKEGTVIHPLAPRFFGRVLVLVGATNSSATFEFAHALQAAKLGTLVGQTTGGNLRGINGGAFFFLRLPNSGIELDLPLIGQFPRTPQPDAGLVPDVPVATRLLDIAQGKDVEMAAARAFLRAPPSR